MSCGLHENLAICLNSVIVVLRMSTCKDELISSM